MRPEYDRIEWLARTDDVAVRINTLGPGEVTPWHFHTEVNDDVFALDEGIEVALRDPAVTVALRPGERQRIEPRRVHRVANRTQAPARYLLIQATGRYDFNAVP